MKKIKEIFQARFYITNVEWFNGDIDNLLNKIIRKEATKEAEWIDNHIKKLLPEWAIKLTPKYHKNRLFKFLVRHISDIDVSVLSEPLAGKRIITIGQKGKQVFRKDFSIRKNI